MSKESARTFIENLFLTSRTQVGEIMMLGVIMSNNNPNRHSAEDINDAIVELAKNGVIDASHRNFIRRLK